MSDGPLGNMPCQTCDMLLLGVWMGFDANLCMAR